MNLTFAEPIWLLGLMLIAVATLRRRRRGVAVLAYPNVGRLAGLPGVGPTPRKLPKIFAACGCGCLFLAAAEPRTPDAKTRLAGEGTALAFVVDVSGSMAEPIEPGGPSRLTAAQATFRKLLLGDETAGGAKFRGRPNDRAALIVFSAVPRTLSPPTFNHAVTAKLLAELQPRSGPDAGTNIGDAIAEATARLEATDAKRKVMILLSDGEHNLIGDGIDGPLKPRQAGRLAESLGIVIHAVDCGGQTADEKAAEQRAEGRRVLAATAEMTGGRFEIAGSGEELDAVIEELDLLERSPALSFRYRRFHNWSQATAILGGVMLTLALMVSQLGRTVRPTS